MAPNAAELQIQPDESISFPPLSPDMMPHWDDLRKPLVDLLLKFYNGEDQGKEFVDALRPVIRVLIRW